MAGRWSELFAFGDSLMMMDHFSDDEPEKLLGKCRVKASGFGHQTKPGDLDPLANRIGWRQLRCRFVPPPCLGYLLSRIPI